MREVAKKIKDYMIYMEASEEEFQIIENLNKGSLKINENNIDIIQKTIMKYATGDLLMVGWGLIKAENATGKKDEKWIKIENNKISRICKEISYLIYTKE